MTSPSTPSPATCQSNFEQGVALALHLWPALTLAVQNNWGGPDSSDKRDWFAGAIVDLFPDVSSLTPAQLQQRAHATATAFSSASSSRQQQTTTATTQQRQPAQNGAAASAAEEPDQEDVEAVLLQVMLDEFEVNVEDDSAFEVAEQVVRLRGECLHGRFDGVEELRRRWEARKGGGGAKVVFQKGEDQDGETDWDTDDDDDEDEEDEREGGGDGEDVEMEEAPALVQTRRVREEPEVDEDGFTKVTRRKR
ncbi:uncharacterized protein THITE_2109881 [Thermothielavioides terrestris NRRL 8126]|uniref:Pre-rRNA-processing protein TSR2 n=1 Tax=Thermothielavioides terrestris (strain ATCC 38088 / NRRL 8126) TaxID=578455 RepID=G2QQU2_THETT|nr:uncharacterized protein THITE_2109881 [Thermothielavioides terrestris NRRL 8126]AEO64101.1 hypothetical protein THITE_2109881 [Thermothielavioides terrestris NRRL 8126]